jgi:hypothetical protein
MASLMETDRKTARKKGLMAAAATGASVAIIATGLPVLGLVVAVPAAYLGWDWFSFRAKRGMRF